MNAANSRPSDSDVSGSDVRPEAGSEEANGSSDTGHGNDPLEIVGAALGRKFDSWEEAEKSLANLNSLVGDRSIAALRSQAELGNSFERLVQGYASENGIGYEDARTELLSLTGESGNGSEGGSAGGDGNDDIRLRLDRQDLLAAHPEAKHVLDDVEAVASAKGLTLEDAWNSTRSLQIAANQMASSSDRNNRGSILSPSQRIQGNSPGRKVSEAIESFKSNRTSGEAADALVAAALGVQR